MVTKIKLARSLGRIDGINEALEAIAAESLTHSSGEGEFYITDKIIAAVEKIKRTP